MKLSLYRRQVRGGAARAILRPRKGDPMRRLTLCAVAALAIGTTAFPGPARAADVPDTPTTSRAARELDAARAAIAKKDWKSAIEQLQAADRKDHRNADVHNLLGYSYRHTGDMDKAFSHYRTALQIDSQHKGAHEYIGQAYLTVKQSDKAREHLARLKTICGEGCEEYQDLAKAIAAYTP
jgi:Flp pilus assembly protein TadD